MTTRHRRERCGLERVAGSDERQSGRAVGRAGGRCGRVPGGKRTEPGVLGRRARGVGANCDLDVNTSPLSRSRRGGGVVVDGGGCAPRRSVGRRESARSTHDQIESHARARLGPSNGASGREAHVIASMKPGSRLRDGGPPHRRQTLAFVGNVFVRPQPDRRQCTSRRVSASGHGGACSTTARFSFHRAGIPDGPASPVGSSGPASLEGVYREDARVVARWLGGLVLSVATMSRPKPYRGP